MSKPLVASLVLVGAFLASGANAASGSPNAVYAHPVRLAAPLLDSEIFPYLALTYERELAGGISLAARPVYFASDRDKEISIEMVSIDLSLRKYAGQESQGLYFAPSLGYTHLVFDMPSGYLGTFWGQASPAKSVSMDGVSLLGRAGWRIQAGRFTGFADVGIGKLFLSEEDSRKIYAMIKDEPVGIHRNDFVYDANLAVGVSF